MDALDQISATLTNDALAYDEKLKVLCKDVLDSISRANRVSFWSFTKDFDAITCLMGYDNVNSEFSSGTVLKQPDFPEYFNAIIKNQIVSAPDARNHPDTRCFNRLYFEPNNIYSLLDYILYDDFTPVGIICCESSANYAQWQADDRQALKRIAVLISTVFKDIKN